MSKKEQVIKLLEDSKANKWPYPKTFAKLKSLGTKSYEVSWDNGYQAIYNLEQESFPEILENGFIQTNISNLYQETEAKKVIYEHQQGKTDYFTLLSQLSQTGISHYVVNMDNYTVTYYSLDGKYSFIENVPKFED